MLFVLTILYLLFQNKKIIDIIAKLGYPMMIIIPIILILLGTPLYDNILAKLLIKKDNMYSLGAISSDEEWVAVKEVMKNIAKSEE